MAQFSVYLHRLDVLSHGYIRQLTSDNKDCPLDIIELIKIWHSYNQCPKLIFNLLLSIDGDIVFECFLDKHHWNILNINKYTLLYNIRCIGFDDNALAPVQGQCHIHNVYDSDTLLAFGKFHHARRWYAKSGEFKLSATDSKGNILIECDYIRQKIQDSISLYCLVRFDEFDIENKGQLSLNEWMHSNYTFSNNAHQYVWKRMFYFVNYMRDKDDKNCFMDKKGLRLLCENTFLNDDYSGISEVLYSKYAE